jgi:hypothetical protein
MVWENIKQKTRARTEKKIAWRRRKLRYTDRGNGGRNFFIKNHECMSRIPQAAVRSDIGK